VKRKITLKIESQILDNQQAKLTVEVEIERLEEAKRRAARKLSNRVKIPGFRPGKAPYAVVLRQIGESLIVDEALETLVEEVYPKILEDAKLKPYGPGKLENILQLNPPILEFIVPLEAEVNLGEYQSIQKSYQLKTIDETDVDKVLRDLREGQAVIAPVSRPAQEGDIVTIHIHAIRTHEEPEKDNGLINDRSTSIIIRSNDELQTETNEWPYRGFSRELIGLSEYDEQQIRYTYPLDSEPVSFRGIEATIFIRVESVKSRSLPAMDDDFARSLGEYSDFQSLRSDIQKNLELQAKKNYDAEYDEAILTEAIKKASFKYPPQMLENEMDDVQDNLKNRLERQKISMDLYMKSRNLDTDGLRNELKPIAETRLKKSLFLSELARVEEIHVKQDEVQETTANTVNYLSNVLPEKEARKLSNQNVYNNLVGNIMVDILHNRAMERFRDICSGKGVEATAGKQVTSSDTTTIKPKRKYTKKRIETQPIE
jgi:trigger factor